jgi:hypothetical protein
MKHTKQNRRPQQRERNSIHRLSEERDPRNQRNNYYDAPSEGHFYEEGIYNDRRNNNADYYEGDPYYRGNSRYSDERYYNDRNREQYPNETEGRGFHPRERDNGYGTSYDRERPDGRYENQNRNHVNRDERGNGYRRDERVYQGPPERHSRNEHERYYDNDRYGSKNQNDRNSRTNINGDERKTNNGRRKSSRTAARPGNGKKNTQANRKKSSVKAKRTNQNQSLMQDKKGKDLLAL